MPKIKISFNSIELDQYEAEYIANKNGWNGQPEKLKECVENAAFKLLAEFISAPKNNEVDVRHDTEAEQEKSENIQEKIHELRALEE